LRSRGTRSASGTRHKAAATTRFVSPVVTCTGKRELRFIKTGKTVERRAGATNVRWRKSRVIYVTSGSGAPIFAISAQSPVYPQHRTYCGNAVNRRSGPILLQKYFWHLGAKH